MRLLPVSFRFLRSMVSLGGLLLVVGWLTQAASAATAIPQRGDVAPGFTLNQLDGAPVDFAAVAREHGAVLIVLRGWPGYQCPFCTTQVREYVGHAADFAARGLPVVMVYPGPAAELQAHAAEFLGNRAWPENFRFVLDPDYAFTRQYGLRWEAKGETAYPATFVVGPDLRVRFAHVSGEHGDRIGAAALLRALAEQP